MADSRSRTVADLVTVVQRQQALLEVQQLQLQAVTEELNALALPLDVEQDTHDQSDSHANFIVSEPGIGFLAQAVTDAGMRRGIVGIGSDGKVGRIAQTDSARSKCDVMKVDQPTLPRGVRSGRARTAA
jgi:cell shape-determining protein MreC